VPPQSNYWRRSGPMRKPAQSQETPRKEKSFSNGMDIQHLPLKPDHLKRPLWIFPYTARNYLDGVEKQNKQSSSSSSSSTTTSSSSKKKIKSNAGECRIIVET